MSAFHIKLIAVSAMAIDHIGLFFFPEAILLRLIGRLSFPLFAWLISNGAYHTSSAKNYLRRLFLLAIISQIPYMAANRLVNSSFFALNVVFTLFLGLLAIESMKITNKKFAQIIIIAFLAIIAQLIQAEYGAMGVIAIVIFHLFYRRLKDLVFWQTLNFALFSLASLAIKLESWTAVSFVDVFGLMNMLGLVSLFFIALYKQKEGPKTKSLFYIFYPLQYIIIYLFKSYLP